MSSDFPSQNSPPDDSRDQQQPDADQSTPDQPIDQPGGSERLHIDDSTSEARVYHPAPAYDPNAGVSHSYPPPTQAPQVPLGPKLGNTLLTSFAWLVILGLTLFIFGSTTYVQFFSTPQATSQDATKSELMPLNLQGKMLLGSKLLFGEQMMNPNGDDNAMQLQIDALNLGPPEVRYAAAILANEFVGTEEALDIMDNVDDLVERLEYDPSDRQKRIRRIVQHVLLLYDSGEYNLDEIKDEDQQFLMDELGWVGELALAPEDSPNTQGRASLESSAQRSTIVFFSATGLGLLALFCGFIGAFAFFILVVSGTIKPTIAIPSNRGRIYAETFAIWFIVFWGGQVLLSLVAAQFLSEVQAFASTLVVFFGSLIVLVWPVFRGIPFRTVRHDIGWKLKNPFVEGFYAVVSYISLLPFMLAGLIFVAILMMMIGLFQATGETNELSSVTAAGHPIQEQFANGDPALLVCAFLALCVAAPVVEETMFRGVLYHHLRDATTGWQRFVSVIFSAILSSLIFAAVHPQGIIGIPLLTTLAMAFALVREWRDSLIAPMIMHAINNGCVALLLFLIL